MGLYTFKEEDAERFASFVGLKTRHRGDQLELKNCPYCRSVTDTWKFGISLKTGQFECKRSSCSVKGNMITLSRDFNFSLGKDVDAYYHSADYSKKQYRAFREKHREITSKPEAVEYLAERGIPEEIVRKYEITASKDDPTIVIFPFRDSDGALTFVKYRKTNFVKGQTSGSKEWCESGCKPILFGMNHCDPDADEGVLIITEGQIDSLSVVVAGYKNAVSVPTGCNGFTWVPYCYDFVNQFRKIVVMGDHENGKITLSEEIAKRWQKKTFVVRPEDYKDCKDANDLLRRYGVLAIQEAIKNAEPTFTSHIKPIAKVQQVDIMSITAISTGMKDLDDALDGGFRLGQLAILTGKRGEGKSTIASMWDVHALNQNFRTFAYSGELTDFFFRNWMDCQVTGKATHNQSENDYLDAWYGDKAYIFDNTIAEDDEFVKLIDTVETAIIQNGCQFILLDNLMTAIDVDLSTDIYRVQSKFVGDLSKLAKKHNVFILLIAHPRKTGSGVAIQNDDISGSSNITDKADIVMSYGRPLKEDIDPISVLPEDQRRLTITKNRLTGKLRDHEHSIHLVYDKSSRRIAGDINQIHEMDFRWNNQSIYDLDDIPDEENPFL